jgi:subtilisin family serine protease
MSHSGVADAQSHRPSPPRSGQRCRKFAAMIAVAFALASPATARDEVDRNAADPASTPGLESQILVMIRMAPSHFRPDVDYSDGYAARSGHAARRRTASDIARTHRLKLLSHWPMPAIGVECYVMQIPPGMTAAAAVDEVSRDNRAAWAQPLQTFRSDAYNDPLYDQQPTATAWRLQALHAAATGRGVLIAQIDSGVEAEHPDLRGQIRLVHNAVAHSRYEAESHGTAVAGVIAARANNGIGTVGVAPEAQLLALRGCWERAPAAAQCDTLSLAKALQMALDRGVRIVNLSVSGPPDRLLSELLNAANGRGVIVVAAASAGSANDGFPASHRGVISVAVIEPVTNAAAPAFAPIRAALAAPGRDIPTTLPGARWGLVSGASFAAAEVSGMVALLLELIPNARAAQIEALLRRGPERPVGDAILAPTPVDACRSMSAATGRCLCDCTTEATYSSHAQR